MWNIRKGDNMTTDQEKQLLNEIADDLILAAGELLRICNEDIDEYALGCMDHDPLHDADRVLDELWTRIGEFYWAGNASGWREQMRQMLLAKRPSRAEA